MVTHARQNFLEDNTLVHKIWRGHNGEWIFKEFDEKLSYLRYLNRTISKEFEELHALCLMSNHSHEIYFVKQRLGFSRFLRKHHTNFGQFYNRKFSRRGPVSECRPKTIPIKSDIHEMISVFYIHANPIRAGIVNGVEELKSYPWSTHLFYGYGIYMEWMKSVVLPEWYLNFGTSDEERQRYYLHLFRQYLGMTEEKFIESIQL